MGGTAAAVVAAVASADAAEQSQVLSEAPSTNDETKVQKPQKSNDGMATSEVVDGPPARTASRGRRLTTPTTPISRAESGSTNSSNCSSLSMARACSAKALEPAACVS